MSRSKYHAATVLDPGPLCLIEDFGRPGHAALGLSPSGAVDKTSLSLANRLVSNSAADAGLEVLGGGLKLRFERSTTIAVTGAHGAVAVGSKDLALNSSLSMRAGDELHLGPAARGMRYYLAFAGGILVPQLLGSSSADLLSRLGPPPLRAGDQLWVSGEEGQLWVSNEGPARAPGAPAAMTVRNPPGTGAIAARIRTGPRREWFEPGAWQKLVRCLWTVSADSNRVGLRLDGPPLLRHRREELPSEGLVAGALQVPPSGAPTIFLADHPVTGGYPVIAVVHPADLDLLGQARPGQQLRFLG